MCSFTKKSHHHGCFSTKFPKIFKKSFLRNTHFWGTAAEAYYLALLNLFLVGHSRFINKRSCTYPTKSTGSVMLTAWKASKYGVFLVQIQENTGQKKLRIWTLFPQWFTLPVLQFFWDKIKIFHARQIL